mmetsp:Transcript_3013/g.6152  ORF Transcript_3013/g.6152 Transcript_3013/m.6152 type:complete len:236 (-) Transcript_3013:241-948(-)
MIPPEEASDASSSWIGGSSSIPSPGTSVSAGEGAASWSSSGSSAIPVTTAALRAQMGNEASIDREGRVVMAFGWERDEEVVLRVTAVLASVWRSELASLTCLLQSATVSSAFLFLECSSGERGWKKRVGLSLPSESKTFRTSMSVSAICRPFAMALVAFQTNAFMVDLSEFNVDSLALDTRSSSPQSYVSLMDASSGRLSSLLGNSTGAIPPSSQLPEEEPPFPLPSSSSLQSPS